ncbi:MAG: hypothetical protein ACKOSQ_10210, partial [Planctomycetaceae bacterium]
MNDGRRQLEKPPKQLLQPGADARVTTASWFFSVWKSSSSRSSGIVSGTNSARCSIFRSSIGQPIQE